MTRPASTARIRIPVESLHNLPEGASFIKKEGDATIQAEKIGEVIHLTANCDSLMSVIFTMEEELTRIRDQLEESSKEVEIIRPSRIFLNGLLSGIGFIIIIYILFKIKRNGK